MVYWGIELNGYRGGIGKFLEETIDDGILIWSWG